MAPAQQSGPDSNQIIVHHLSDVRHKESVEDGQRNNVLTRYQRYLHDERLPRERRPDFVVITGDLTANGTRAELNAVATALRICFAQWEGSLHEHVVVVPGPHDVNWESTEKVGLGTFYEIFSDFATPMRAPAIGWRGVQESRREAYIGYPLDTCYAPDNLTPDLKNNFNQYIEYYDELLDSRAKLGKRRRWLWKPRGRDRDQAQALQPVREHYLELTEGVRLIDLYAGRILAPDVQQFKRWSDQFQGGGASASGAAPLPGDTAIPPLKVLITHHPIDIRTEEGSGGKDWQPAQTAFKQVASIARAGGFQLALHGHIHKPELFSEQSVFEGFDSQRPLRRLGAASLDDTGCFNEITAVYRGEPGQGAWRLDLRLVDLGAADAVSNSAVELPNPATKQETKNKLLRRSVDSRSAFEINLRHAMRRFTEDANQARPGYRPNQAIPPLPQGALLRVQDAVAAIFSDCDTRVRLLLKNNEDRDAPVPRLVPTYLDPVIMDGPETLIYPASVAAWALVLGRTLKFPDIQKQVTQPEDHAWLRSSRKIPELLKALVALEASAKTSNDGKAELRYHTLISNLEAIQGPSSGQETAQIIGSTIFQASPGANPPRSYLGFICVPYPMRPPGGALPTVSEIAVLDIGVRPKQNPDKANSAEIPTFPFIPFTDERVEMLETLTELIGLMLVNADALGKPPGVWHARP